MTWCLECTVCGQIVRSIPTDDREEAAQAHEATHTPASEVWSIYPAYRFDAARDMFVPTRFDAHGVML